MVKSLSFLGDLLEICSSCLGEAMAKGTRAIHATRHQVLRTGTETAFGYSGGNLPQLLQLQAQRHLVLSDFLNQKEAAIN